MCARYQSGARFATLWGWMNHTGTRDTIAGFMNDAIRLL